MSLLTARRPPRRTLVVVVLPVSDGGVAPAVTVGVRAGPGGESARARLRRQRAGPVRRCARALQHDGLQVSTSRHHPDWAALLRAVDVVTANARAREVLAPLDGAQVHFGDWVPYAYRLKWLAHCDVVVTRLRETPGPLADGRAALEPPRPRFPWSTTTVELAAVLDELDPPHAKQEAFVRRHHLLRRSSRPRGVEQSLLGAVHLLGRVRAKGLRGTAVVARDRHLQPFAALPRRCRASRRAGSPAAGAS